MNKYDIKPIKVIPIGAEFLIGSEYGKLVDGILHIYRHSSKSDGMIWKSLGVSLDEYNTLIVDHNKLTIYDVLKIQANDWCKKGKTLYIFRYYYDSFYVSYNKPVMKHGFLRCGQRVCLDHNRFPIVNEFMENFNIREVLFED